MMCFPRSCRSGRSAGFMVVVLGLVLIGCQANNPPGPTAIPTASRTSTAAPSPSVSAAPSPTLRPVIEATIANPTAAPVVDVPTAAPQATAMCMVARQGDTITSLLYKGGYGLYSPFLADQFRQVNNMPAGSNNIQAGQTYCVPQPTPTPSPPGYQETLVSQMTELPLKTRSFTIANYVIKEGDTIMSLQFDLNVTLRELCDLNSPSPINCGGCNIDAPIGQQGCRPILRVGDTIHIPGPTPTPTITPTLTGSETVTPTPPYGAPKLVAPVNGASVTGTALLLWTPVAILQPDEQYLVMVTEPVSLHTWQFETQATSFRLPSEIQSNDGQPHTMNWQVMVVRKSADGAYLVVGQKSVIYSFTWQAQ